MRLQTKGGYSLDDMIDLLVGHMRFQDDDHGELGARGSGPGARDAQAEVDAVGKRWRRFHQFSHWIHPAIPAATRRLSVALLVGDLQRADQKTRFRLGADEVSQAT